MCQIVLSISSFHLHVNIQTATFRVCAHVRANLFDRSDRHAVRSHNVAGIMCALRVVLDASCMKHFEQLSISSSSTLWKSVVFMWWNFAEVLSKIIPTPASQGFKLQLIELTWTVEEHGRLKACFHEYMNKAPKFRPDVLIFPPDHKFQPNLA